MPDFRRRGHQRGRGYAPAAVPEVILPQPAGHRGGDRRARLIPLEKRRCAGRPRIAKNERSCCLVFRRDGHNPTDRRGESFLTEARTNMLALKHPPVAPNATDTPEPHDKMWNTYEYR